VETKKISELFAVCSIFVDTKLEILGELLVEFLVVFLVLSDFSEHFQALLYDILLDNLENTILLEGLTRNVQGEIV
jgi:hypothetical protein